MAVSTFDEAAFDKYFKEKLSKGRCPMCSQSSWTADKNLFELRAFHGGNMVIGSGPIMPLVVLTCNNCGWTSFVNALISKLVESPDQGDAS